MTATIYDLRRATGSPATHFRRLAAAVCEERILRTSYFAETRIRLEGRPYTLFMPLSGNAMVRVEPLRAPEAESCFARGAADGDPLRRDEV